MVKEIKGMFNYVYIDGVLYIDTTKYYGMINLRKFQRTAIIEEEEIEKTIKYFEKTFKMLENEKIKHSKEAKNE